MSLTKEMIISIEEQVENFSDEELIIYNRTYTGLNTLYPNSYYGFMISKSREEMITRGLDNGQEAGQEGWI